MRKSRKKWVTWLIVSAIMALSVMIGSVSLAATDLSSEVYLAQQGSSTCTLASAAMMIRARFYKSNNSLWKSVTESSIRSKAWIEGSGLRHSWSYSIDNNSVSVAHSTVSGISVSSLKSLLNSHPEGIVLYCGKLPHAVFLTDYDGDTFYCADPIQSYSGKRISLAASYLGKKYGSQAGVLNNVTAYWYISSYTISSNTIIEKNIVFEQATAKNITSSNAVISAWGRNKGTMQELGFYIGMDGLYQNQSKIVVARDIAWTDFYMQYDINSYYGVLNPGQKYRYSFFCVKEGHEYKSDEATFITSGSAQVSFDSVGVTEISSENAKVKCWGSNPNAQLLSAIGFEIGSGYNSTDKKIYKVLENKTWTRAEFVFNLSSYCGNLNPDKKYYVRIYADSGNKRYYSDYIIFKTPSNVVSFDEVDINNVTDTNATLSVWLNNSGVINEIGLYIGDDEHIQDQIVYARGIEWTRANIVMDISRYWKALKPGHTYTYVFYAKKGDKEYRSKPGQFMTTGKKTINFETVNISNITDTGAKVEVWFSNDQALNLKSIGFDIRDSNYKEYTTVEAVANVKWTRAYLNYNISNYKSFLKPDTIYNVRYYIDAGTERYYSDFVRFRTKEDATPPVISNVTTSDISEDGYTITCNIKDNGRIDKIIFQSWTEGNGKDDLLEEKGTLNGNVVTYRVRTADHNNESGKYITNICVFDAKGNKTQKEITQIVKQKHVHEYIVSIKKAATCTASGIRLYTCEAGDDSYEEKIPATGHLHTELRNAKAATCTAEGYTGDTYCKDCGAKLQTGKATAKKAHTWDAGKITQAATCVKTGIKTYTCTVCKTTKTENVPATGNHKNTELRNAKEATCTAEGYTGDTYCKDCGAKLQTGKATAKKAHTWDAGKITQAATCVKTGIKTYTCTVCKTTKTENVPATGNHKNTELRNAKEATCTTEGYTGDTYCKDCGTKLQTGKAIAKKSHTWDAGKITQEATCAKTGIKTYTCTVCKTTKTENVPATGNHKNTELHNVKEATCTEEGYTGDTYCKDCGSKIASGQKISKTEHTWNSGVITTSPTCVERGVKIYTCNICQTTRTEELPATGNHQNTELRNAKEATCTAEGYTGDIYCQDCGTKLQTGNAIAKKAHTWDAGIVTKTATCTESGVKTYTCTLCKATKTEEVPATGNHEHTELRDAREATCAEDGYTGDLYCKDCGTKLQTGKTIAKKAHTWDAGVITTPASCTEKGIKTYTCTSCGGTKTNELPSSGHKQKEVRNKKAATCMQSGYTGDTYCKDCGKKLSSGKAIAKLAHKWDAGVITQEATCTEAGIRTYMCTVCESTKIEEIPANGHGETVTKFAKEATCKMEGYTGDLYCMDCGELLEEGSVIEKLPHQWDAGKITKKATTSTTGIRTYTCTKCGATKKETIPKVVPKKATPGKTVKDSATNGIYKVLADGLTVTFVRPAAKRATVRIPETVKVSGVTCKVTEISANAFKNDAVLKTVVIGKNVKTIGANAFYGCKNLTKVSGGAALVTICDRAFSNCAALQGIVLPSTVKGIGKQAFYNCKKLRSITINTFSLTSKNVGAQAFTGTYAKAVVKVPAKKFAAYKSLLRAKGMNVNAVYSK